MAIIDYGTSVSDAFPSIYRATSECGAGCVALTELNLVRLVADGSVDHLRDLDELEAAGCAVPEGWRPCPAAFVPSGEARYWVSRKTSAEGRTTQPLGVMLRVARSRRVPWARIVRVETLGTPYLAERATALALLIRDAVRQVGRVMRADARVLHRDAAVRSTIAGALRAVGFKTSARMQMYRHTRALSLAGGEAQLFRQLPASFRQRLRDPLKRGLTLQTNATAADIPRLLQLAQSAFSRTASALQQSLMRRDLALAIAEPTFRPLITLERPNVYGPERIVAFALGAFNGDHVTYVHGAAERGGDLAAVSLSYAPVWELVCWAAAHEVEWFDLGGIPKSQDPSHRMAGIAAFKRRFGGEDIEVATELRWERSAMNTKLESLVGRALGR